MKTFKLIALGSLLLYAVTMQAQVSVTLNVGPPPAWGPSESVGVQYYYLPDVEAYYDVQSSMFIYRSGGLWVHRTYLPRRYRNYDLYNGYKVVLNDYHGRTPYTNYEQHRRTYSRGYHGARQQTYGERPRETHPPRDMHPNRDGKRDTDRRNDRNDKHGKEKDGKKDRGHDKGQGDRK